MNGKGKGKELTLDLIARQSHRSVLGKAVALTSPAERILPMGPESLMAKRPSLLDSTRWPLTLLILASEPVQPRNAWIHTFNQVTVWSLVLLGVIRMFTIWSFHLVLELPSQSVIEVPNSWRTPHHRACLRVYTWSGVHFKLISILSIMQITDCRAMAAQQGMQKGSRWGSKESKRDGGGQEGQCYLKSQSFSHIQRHYFSH